MVGRCVSFWDGLFSGAMSVSGRVDESEDCLRCYLSLPKQYMTLNKNSPLPFLDLSAHPWAGQ